MANQRVLIAREEQIVRVSPARVHLAACDTVCFESLTGGVILMLPDFLEPIDESEIHQQLVHEIEDSGFRVVVPRGSSVCFTVREVPVGSYPYVVSVPRRRGVFSAIGHSDPRILIYKSNR